jgi:hypothetical protein
MAIAAAAPAHSAGPVAPVQGNVSPLYGNINPFYGNINPFYGNINPFYGNINPFYGNINPFWGNTGGYWGTVTPFSQATDPATQAFFASSRYDAFWGRSNPYLISPNGVNYASLGTFWKGEFSAWAPILANWNATTSLSGAASVAAQLQNNLISPTSSFWTPIAQRFGNRDALGLIQSKLRQAGVTFNADGSINAASLLKSDPSQRAMLFLNLYDSLMDYAGTGHVDWWMGQVGWSPLLAQIQGTRPAGILSTPTIGMIDFVIQNGRHTSRQVTQYGSTAFADGHGAAVGSLIIGATDGSGVMGVMPQGSGKVLVYDPYDDTNTTNWTDVGTGIRTLVSTIFNGQLTPQGVLNASLGVPGWTLNPGWNDALRNAGAHGHDLVVAAGNDGVTQTQNVPWNFDLNPTLLIVGSVGADGTISNFSNRPGEACLLPAGAFVCTEANKLKYRFIVAPGELILVSDGMGGHVRQSGTSLAAPLVSGAIALLQNRWPWLSNYPDETAQIILRSATPKGSHPGADPVYGVGELNIAASQAPLDWNRLVFYQKKSGTVSLTPIGLAAVATQLNGGTQSSWDASGLWYSAFETIGNTYRDFQIPLSSKLVGLNAQTNAGGQAFQSNLSMALRAQAGHFAAIASPEERGNSLISGFARSAVPAGQFGGMQLRVSVTPAEIGNAFQARSARYATDAMLVTDRASFQFGYGHGAAALDGSAAFAFGSDYDLAQGGANPLLGLASGGTYLGARTILVSGLTIGFGSTDRNMRRNLGAFGLQPAQAGDWVARYAASAQNVNLAYALSRRVTVRFGFTHLAEQSALLGIQSLDRADLAGGSATDGMTTGIDLGLPHGLTLAGSATIARTQTGAGQITTRNLTSASAELALIKTRLFTRTDELRLSLASPLHTVGGHLTYSSIGVVDRATGAMGIVDQTFHPRGRLPLAGQAMYGLALPKGKGEFSLFGRADRDSELIATDRIGYTAGAQIRLAF